MCSAVELTELESRKLTRRWKWGLAMMGTGAVLLMGSVALGIQWEYAGSELELESMVALMPWAVGALLLHLPLWVIGKSIRRSAMTRILASRKRFPPL